jgi:hypothetical protein
VRPIEFYEIQARDLIQGLREQKQVSFEQLALRLLEGGETVQPKVLANRINRGKFSLALTLQLLAAMDVSTLKLPKPWAGQPISRERIPTWVDPNTPAALRWPKPKK